MTRLLALYVWLVAVRATALVTSGEPVGVVLGMLAFWVLPLLVVGLVAREWRLAVDDGWRRARRRRRAPVDTLPRSPGGRIDRAAARDAFEDARAVVDTAPEDWRSWYHLAFAYDAAGARASRCGPPSRLHHCAA